MKKIFLYLLKRYSSTEAKRQEIYKQLWDKVCDEYNEQTLPGNVYNMNIEVLMSNPFFIKCCKENDNEYLKMLKAGLSNSFDESVQFVKNEKI
jgi:hypothetical protein